MITRTSRTFATKSDDPTYLLWHLLPAHLQSAIRSSTRATTRTSRCEKLSVGSTGIRYPSKTYMYVTRTKILVLAITQRNPHAVVRWDNQKKANELYVSHYFLLA